MSERRTAFVHLVTDHHCPVAQACRRFGISRKTGHKWLQRYRHDPHAPLNDRSRRPAHSPGRTPDTLEQQVLQVRDQFGWGARKIHAYLQHRQVQVPSIATVNQILKRHQRLHTPKPQDPHTPLQRFERSRPNELWQLDFKGPLEVGRRPRHPLTILDDHSRYLLAIRLRDDHTMAGVWEVLWECFGQVGLPENLLCDNEFGTAFHTPRTLSWFESCLVRLDIRPIHGRAYHPQTQGKIERVHRTFEDELYPHVRCDCQAHFHQDAEAYRLIYNTQRPHQALDDQPPVTRWVPSPRPRPDTLPEPRYPPGAQVRKVSTSGDIRWRTYRILAGYGLIGQSVRVEETEHSVQVYYCHRLIRTVPVDQLRPRVML